MSRVLSRPVGILGDGDSATLWHSGTEGASHRQEWVVADNGRAVELIAITKTYPGVIANDKVNLSVGLGEIHAIVGENGAGKSTLMNMLYGMQIPDSGEIKVEADEVDADSFASPPTNIDAIDGRVHVADA